jgi:hypothetical protein
LAEAVASLRADLLAAIVEGQGKDLQFGLGDVELTLQLVATKHGGAKIGWSLLGIDGSYDAARTHVAKLTLQPAYRTTAGGYTRDFTIASQTLAEPRVGPEPLPGG